MVSLPLVFTDKRLEQKQYVRGNFRDGEASEISVSGQDGTSGNFEIDATSLLTGRGSLEETIPGIPGEDFPIFFEIPETSFRCDGQVNGGFYADPEAECQAFHICSNDGNEGLTKFSFLCPNGTMFQQKYFVCDWWFNVDCSTSEQFYFLNELIGAESGKVVPRKEETGKTKSIKIERSPEDGLLGSASSQYAAYASTSNINKSIKTSKQVPAYERTPTFYETRQATPSSSVSGFSSPPIYIPSSYGGVTQYLSLGDYASRKTRRNHKRI